MYTARRSFAKAELGHAALINQANKLSNMPLMQNTNQLNLDLNYKFLKFDAIATQAIKCKALYS